MVTKVPTAKVVYSPTGIRHILKIKYTGLSTPATFGKIGITLCGCTVPRNGRWHTAEYPIINGFEEIPYFWDGWCVNCARAFGAPLPTEDVEEDFEESEEPDLETRIAALLDDPAVKLLSFATVPIGTANEISYRCMATFIPLDYIPGWGMTLRDALTDLEDNIRRERG